MEIAILSIVVFAALCAAVASGKHRNVWLWAFLGGLAGILAFLVLICLPKGVNGMKRCENCAEHIEPSAKICKHCKSEV